MDINFLKALSGDINAILSLEQTLKTAKEELDEFNILSEFNAIKEYYDISNKFESKYQEARYKILKYIITCALHDPQKWKLL